MDFDDVVVVMNLTAIARYQWCTKKTAKMPRTIEGLTGGRFFSPNVFSANKRSKTVALERSFLVIFVAFFEVIQSLSGPPISLLPPHPLIRPCALPTILRPISPRFLESVP